MRYQNVLGNCDTTTVNQMTDRCPETLAVLHKYAPDINEQSQQTIKAVAESTGTPPRELCRDLFDKFMEQQPLEDMDTDLLLEMIVNAYDIKHLEQLPQLHRLARKIEAVHRANPDVPKGLTLAVKDLETVLDEHIRHESNYVLSRMEHDQPPRPETPIAQMNDEHSLLKKHLARLRALTGHYQAPESACRSWRRLYDELKELDFGLSEQIYLEGNILFPRFQF